MVLGQPERLEPQLFGENALAHLVYQGLLRRPVDLLQRAVVERDAVFVRDDRQAGRPVVKQADFQHGYSLRCVSIPANRGSSPCPPARACTAYSRSAQWRKRGEDSGLHAGGGYIIMSSVAGHPGSAGLAGYCATKGGVRLFAKAVAMECAAAEVGIRVKHRPPRGHRHADSDEATGIGRTQRTD